MALVPRRSATIDLTADGEQTVGRPGASGPADPAQRADFEAAFPDLYLRSLRLARRFLGSAAAAEDVAAESMARALVRWGRLDPERRAGWVLRVTANQCIDLLRRKGRILEAGVIDLEEATTLRLALNDAVRRLPRRQREVVALRYLADLSEAEVAAALGLSAGSVKTHAHRGLATLRQTLGAETMEVVGGTAS